MKFKSSTYSIILLVLLITVLSYLIQRLMSNNYFNIHSFSLSISDVKDIVNIIFFVVVGLLGVLSYLQAKKTIFTPIKTETFKLQLKAFENIFSYFDRHKKQSFIDGFDYRKILKINSTLAIDNYANTFFKDKFIFDKNRIEQMLKEVPYGNMSPNHIDKFVGVINNGKLDLSLNIDPNSDHKVKIEKWTKFEHVMTKFTENFQNQMDILDSFISSPVVPASVKKIICEFQASAYKNIHLIAEIITESAREFPSRYPTKETLLNADTMWIWNSFNQKRIRLEDIAESIYKEINKYLNIENLLC